MKKSLLATIILFSMALLVLPVQANAESVDYREGTKIELIGQAQNEYTVTVPADMTPGQTDKILIEGTWDADCFVTVTAPAMATLTYKNTTLEIPITFNETVEDKAGFSLLGNKFEPIHREFNITIGDQSVLFGEWTGTLSYDVTLVVKGDVDQNGFVDEDDITALTNHVNGATLLTTEGQLVADIDGDAALTSNDATLLNSMITNNTPNRSIPQYALTQTFNIDGVHYEFIEGMTWDDWCNSPYNTNNLIVHHRDFTYYIATPDEEGVFDSVIGQFVDKSHTIVANRTYTWGTIADDLGNGDE